MITKVTNGTNPATHRKTKVLETAAAKISGSSA
jgi:hypothetical protein